MPGVIKCEPICQQLWPQMNGRQLPGWREYEEGNPSIMVIAFVWSCCGEGLEPPTCMRPKFIAGLPETWGKPVEPAASLLKSGVKGCSVVVTVQNARAALRVNHIWNIDCKNCMIQLIYLNFFSILDNSLVSGGKSQIISKVARFFFHWLSSFSQNVPSWTKMLWTIHDPTWSKNHYTK